MQGTDFIVVHRGFTAKLDPFGLGLQAALVGAFQYALTLGLGPRPTGW